MKPPTIVHTNTRPHESLQLLNEEEASYERGEEAHEKGGGILGNFGPRVSHS